MTEDMIKRPIVTQEMKLEAAQKLCSAVGWPANYAEDIAEQYGMHMDGFELAKALDQRCGWDTSRDDMDELDGMDSNVRELLKAAEKAWFEANNIQPPLPIGAKVNTPNNGKGEITGIYQYDVARYEVKPIGQDDAATGNRRFIINFEDAEVAE